MSSILVILTGKLVSLPRRSGPWVVYQKPVKGVPDRMRGICEQWEWDAMELARPGVNTHIQAGIVNEGEAEQLTRARPVRSARAAPGGCSPPGRT
jgi:hypothetical protein